MYVRILDLIYILTYMHVQCTCMYVRILDLIYILTYMHVHLHVGTVSPRLLLEASHTFPYLQLKRVARGPWC